MPKRKPHQSQTATLISAPPSTGIPPVGRPPLDSHEASFQLSSCSGTTSGDPETSDRTSSEPPSVKQSSETETASIRSSSGGNWTLRPRPTRNPALSYHHAGNDRAIGQHPEARIEYTSDESSLPGPEETSGRDTNEDDSSGTSKTDGKEQDDLECERPSQKKPRFPLRRGWQETLTGAESTPQEDSSPSNSNSAESSTSENAGPTRTQGKRPRISLPMSRRGILAGDDSTSHGESSASNSISTSSSTAGNPGITGTRGSDVRISNPVKPSGRASVSAKQTRKSSFGEKHRRGRKELEEDEINIDSTTGSDHTADLTPVKANTRVGGAGIGERPNASEETGTEMETQDSEMIDSADEHPLGSSQAEVGRAKHHTSIGPYNSLSHRDHIAQGQSVMGPRVSVVLNAGRESMMGRDMSQQDPARVIGALVRNPVSLRNTQRKRPAHSEPNMDTQKRAPGLLLLNVAASSGLRYTEQQDPPQPAQRVAYDHPGSVDPRALQRDRMPDYAWLGPIGYEGTGSGRASGVSDNQRLAVDRTVIWNQQALGAPSGEAKQDYLDSRSAGISPLLYQSYDLPPQHPSRDLWPQQAASRQYSMAQQQQDPTSTAPPVRYPAFADSSSLPIVQLPKTSAMHWDLGGPVHSGSKSVLGLERMTIPGDPMQITYHVNRGGQTQSRGWSSTFNSDLRTNRQPGNTADMYGVETEHLKASASSEDGHYNRSTYVPYSGDTGRLSATKERAHTSLMQKASEKQWTMGTGTGIYEPALVRVRGLPTMLAASANPRAGMESEAGRSWVDPTTETRVAGKWSVETRVPPHFNTLGRLGQVCLADQHAPYDFHPRDTIPQPRASTVGVLDDPCALIGADKIRSQILESDIPEAQTRERYPEVPVINTMSPFDIIGGMVDQQSFSEFLTLSGAATPKPGVEPSIISPAASSHAVGTHAVEQAIAEDASHANTPLIQKYPSGTDVDGFPAQVVATERPRPTPTGEQSSLTGRHAAEPAESTVGMVASSSDASMTTLVAGSCNNLAALAEAAASKTGNFWSAAIGGETSCQGPRQMTPDVPELKEMREMLNRHAFAIQYIMEHCAEIASSDDIRKLRERESGSSL